MDYLRILSMLIVISAIASIPSQSSIVKTLKKNGYDCSMFMFLPSDLIKFRKIMIEESDLSIKTLMKIMYLGYIVPLIIGFSSLITIILIFVFK